MSSFFYRILEWIRLLFGVMPRSGFGSAIIFLVIHYCFIAIVTIILAWQSDNLRELIGPDQAMNANLPDFVRRMWWGIIFLIVYLIMRVVLYLMEVLGLEDDSEFPDIESDWKEILETLASERLPIDDIPLFLVNGFTPQQEQSAFEAASGIEWRVIAPPLTKRSAVLRAFANDNAIYLSCTDIGASNLQQGKVSNESPAADRSAMAPPSAPGVTGTMNAGHMPASSAPSAPPRSPTGTAPAGISAAAAVPPPSAVPAEGAPKSGIGGFFGTIAPGGLKRAMESFSELRKGDNKGFGKKKLAPLNDLETMLGIRRMEFVCELISQARRPYCPVNGMLQAVPFSWAEDIDYGRKLVPAIRDDIATVHESLQLQFPVVTVITELDDVSGMREFILRAERMQPGLRLSRAGSSFAAGADVSDSNASWVVSRSIHWFRGWVYSAFSYDMDNRDNQKLFSMLCEINQRHDGLVTLLRESLYKVTRPHPRLYGCYFCATGKASTEQGFIRGVLDKLPESQGDVSWTPQLKQSQKRTKTIGWVCLVGAILFAVASVALFLNLVGDA